MPLIRNRWYAEVESTGRVKASLDVLLWLTPPTQRDCLKLVELEILRDCLATVNPAVCEIRLHVPEVHTATIEPLTNLHIGFSHLPLTEPADPINGMLGVEATADMRVAVATALACDADVFVTNQQNWFPFLEAFYDCGVLLADTAVLQRQAELFVRGHDVPWAFEDPVWNLTWSAFYQMTEPTTFAHGTEFLETAQRRNATPETIEAARTLIHNRLPNLCFARDRLLFYDLQQNAAKRAGWKRQNFSFEAAYHLNFYYLLLYGGFDHVALVVSNALGLGLPEKQVGATRQNFLTALAAKSASLAALFNDAAFVGFTKRIGALRHFAAHRGSIMPTKLIEKPDVEPTTAEIDAEIAKQGLDAVLLLFPAGARREQFREVLRFNTKIAMYEKGEVLDGIVPVTIDGKHCIIRPMNDTEWNFEKFNSFMDRVLIACAAVM